MKKCSLEKLFPSRVSLEAMRTTPRNEGRWSSGSGGGSDAGDGDGLLDNADFIKNRKEGSTVLVRRFFKNNQKVSPSTIGLSVGLLV